MTQPPRPVPAPAALARTDRSPAAPLFCWLVIQLLALSLGALRVPLSARFPPPGEQFALHIVLATQVVASALLFPLLLRDVKTSAMVILTIAPFVQLASYLSIVGPARAALATAYVAAWLTTLALWRMILRGHRSRMLGVACALALSLGGAIVWYVRAESRGGAPIDWSRDGVFGPILGGIAQVEAGRAPSAAWIAITLLLIGSAALQFALQNREVGRSGSPSASA